MAHPVRGIVCRKCRKSGCRVTGRYHPPIEGVRVRYLMCPSCGYKFRSVEIVGGAIPKKPDKPISLD